MIRIVRGAILLAAVLSLCACQNPTSTTSTTADYYTLTVSPDPTTAQASSGVFYTVHNANKPDETYEYDWKTSFIVTVADSSNYGAKITSASVTVQQASGGIVVSPPSGETVYYEFTTHSISNRVEGKSSASISFDVWYSLPNKGKEALVTVTLSFYDDDDVTYSASESVRVLP